MEKQNEAWISKSEFLQKEKQWCKDKIKSNLKEITAYEKRIKDLELKITLLKASQNYG